MNRRRFFWLAALAPASIAFSQEGAPRQPGFGWEIERFLEEDRKSPPPRGAIVFIGSSIFREWADLKVQMAPLPVINRAFGGSRTWEVLYYADRIVLPYKPKIVVYYCGSNDIGSGSGAAQVVAGFQAFVDKVAASLPQTRIFFVSINKAPEKQGMWSVVDDANARVRDYAKGNPRVGYIEVNAVLFDAAGKPHLDLYQDDELHLRPAAYAGFAKVIKPVIERAWKAR